MRTEDAEMQAWLRKFSTDRPRWGWRRAAKNGPPGGLAGIVVALGAISPIRPKVIWAMDFQFDTPPPMGAP